MEIPNAKNLSGKFTVPPVYTTQAQENQLRRIVSRLIRDWRSELEIVLAVYSTAASSGFDNALRSIRARTSETIADIEESLRDFLINQEIFHRKKWVGRVKSVSGFDIGPILDQTGVREALQIALSRNVALIKGLDDEIAKKVSLSVYNAYAGGLSTSKLTKELRERLGFAPGRARLIARDQLGKLNAELTKVRHTEAGVKSFVWETSGDERVRAEHEALDMKEFTYAKPPSVGLPGEPINCRCVASAVLVFTKEPENVFQ